MTQETVLEQATTQRSMTLLNMAGDVQIVWDEHNREAVLEYAREKMAEGYSFYVLKEKAVFGVKRDVKYEVTEDNFDKVTKNSKGIVIPDESLNDLIQRGVATLAPKSRKESTRELDLRGAKRLKTPEEVVDNDTVALKPLVGG